jgi:hypothetical protein
MTTWERILAIIGAVGAIVAFVDTYFLKSSLASALSIPPTMPTGLIAILLLGASVSVIIALIRISALDRRLGQSESEKSMLLNKLTAADAQIGKLQEEVQRFHAMSKSTSDLQDRIYALLIRREASVEQIMHELRIDRSEFQNVMSAIAQLINADKIERGSLSSDYKAKKK